MLNKQLIINFWTQVLADHRLLFLINIFIKILNKKAYKWICWFKYIYLLINYVLATTLARIM